MVGAARLTGRACGADVRRIDDSMFDSISHSHAGYRTPDHGPHAEHEPHWLFYCPYELEVPPPARYERLAPPPPAIPPVPAPEPVKYQAGLMTQALFDWSVGHVPVAPGTHREGWVGSSSNVIPERLAEITIVSLLFPPPDEPW